MSSTRLQNLKLSTSPSNSDAEPSSSRRPAKRLKTGVPSETTETEAHVVSNDHIKDTRIKTKSKTQTKMQQRGIETEFDDEHDRRTSKTKGKNKATANDPVPEDFPPRGSSLWRVGPHVSAAGGVENAVYNAASLGCVDAFQVFHAAF